MPVKIPCLNITVPDSLKTALEFLDVMHNSVNGSKHGVKKAFEQTSRNETPAEFYDFTLALENASKLRSGIVGYNKVGRYGEYALLEKSGDDTTCGFRIIAILKDLLPKLIETLKFLYIKVGQIDNAHWGGQQCNGGSIDLSYRISGYGGVELRDWLIDRNTEPPHSLKRGYRYYELSTQVGDGLKGSLQALVGGNNGHLQKLNRDIQPISPPDKPHDNDHGGSSTAGPPLRAPSQGPTQTHQDSGYPPEEPPAETPPSHNGGDSSTAAIGGAVGATGLVGGGAAVYFLNVGGIRTLIAG
ncbi:non ribosomal peptide synthase [Babesia caballi]|uniref:Non ribosomal peptide synthase n=1 Tax=Babesia caballi TaxID=5871 RepID=A0AAV4LPQ4_BABCB|nr:non ribosomal peptide synthase [Babesia caballi]